MLKFLAPAIRELVSRAPLGELEEVRLRLQRPLMLKDRTGYFYLSPQAQPAPSSRAYLVTGDDLERTLQLITESS